MAQDAFVASCYLVIAGISKLNNVDALCFSAAAHGVTPIIVGLPAVDEEHFASLEPKFQYIRFALLSEAVEYLRDRDISIVGIEILEVSVPFTEFQYPTAVALMPGNEGTGLSEPQKKVCSGFVYIPQVGAGTASLNVHVATSLVLNFLAKRRFQRH